MKLLLISALFITNILILLPTNFCCALKKNELQANIERLTNNFFANLREDPHLKDKTLSDSSKTFIDKQVANYMALIRQTHGLLEHSVTRRSLPIEDMAMLTRDSAGVYILDGFRALYNINAHFPKDIILFQHKSKEKDTWFAAALECRIGRKAYHLVLYVFINAKFMEIKRVPIVHGVKLAVYSTSTSHYIVVAEMAPPQKDVTLEEMTGIGLEEEFMKRSTEFDLQEDFEEQSTVFKFDGNDRLTKIQTLKRGYASDVVIWEQQQQVFMSIAQFTGPTSENEDFDYEVNTPIYKWLGGHFDVMQDIKTYGVKKITPFAIGNSHFIAVANFKNNRGDTRIYSEIFKYNLHAEKFESYQKILTNAAVDVKYFNLKENNAKEHFLVFANLFETDNDRSENYNTDSIVYKYIDDYFIPFQGFKVIGATEWLPVTTGLRGEFVLLVACKFEGVKAFQYDGWKFVESQVPYTNDAFSRGVVSMRSYYFHGKPVVVVANENDYHGGMMNVFEPHFVHQNMLNEFQNDMLSWCEQSLQSFEVLEFEKITKHVEAAPKHDDSMLQLAQSIAFNDLTIENLHTLEPNTTDSEEVVDLNDLEEELNAYSEELREIEEQLKMSMHTTDVNTFHGDVFVGKLILNNSDSFFESLTAETINDIEVSPILGDVININRGFTIENSIKFDTIAVENELFPKFVNGHPIEVLNQDTQEGLYDLIIEGNVVFNDGVTMDGPLNGINFTKDNVLLKKGDQTLGNLQADAITSDTFAANSLNNIEMSQMNSESGEKTLLQNIENLNVKTVYIGGFMNKVDVPTLNKYALKTFGDQILTNEYAFDSLQVDNINTRSISGKRIPEDLILTKEGNYRIEHDVKFLSDLNANAINITDRLNDIDVINGQLDVLLVNAPYVQHIRGYKEFENVKLLNPIRLQGRINSLRMEKMNPVTIIDGELVLTGDYFIRGDVKIEKLLQTVDMQSADSLSVQRLQNKGVKITESTVPVHLRFSQQLNVLEVFADRINDVEIDSLVKMGLEEPQIITGWKEFLSDVQISGPTKLENVNGINLQDFESGVMKIYGDQTLSGKYHFENVVANRIFNVKTEFGGNLWENVVTIHGDQNIAGTTLIANSVQANQLEAQILNSNTINGYDFTHLINDTVLHGQKLKISGRKQFIDLNIDNLDVSSLDMHELPKLIESTNATFEFDEDIVLPDGIIIENILFSDRFNDVPSESLGRQWSFSESEQFVESDQNFNKITILGELSIMSGFMNDVKIEDFRENSVKIDEHFHFASATFPNGLASLKRITLDGQFESLDLNDVVQSHINTEQIINGQITFNGDVTIFGEVFFNGLMSGLNLTQACKFPFPLENEAQKSLHINGNVYFAIGPEAYYINARPVRNILDNAWFTDRQAQITGIMEFDQALFQEDLTVYGFVDGVKVELMAQTYLSRTRDQNISSLLDFDDNVVFASGVYAKKAGVGGDVGGINLNEFMQTALLNGYQQTFENTVFVEECRILNLQGNYKVNNLDLQTDVLRYTGENIVTGNKVIYDVHTIALTLPRRAKWKELKIQTVRLLDFLETAILKNGTFEITGGVAFHNRTKFLNGISSRSGRVNGVQFNNQTVMLKSLPQNVTGYKSFAPRILTGYKSYPDNVSEPVKFRSMMLKGRLNGIDMFDLMENQAYKNQDTVFNSPVNFNADLATSNINMEDLYQGMNLTEMLGNVTHFETAKDYYDTYENLLNVSTNVRDSLQAQAYFLDYYKVQTIYHKVDIIVPVQFDSTDAQHLASIVKGPHNYSIEFDVWDKEAEYFRDENQIQSILSNKQLHYLKPIIFKNQELWYMEHKRDAINFDPRAAPTISPMDYEGGIYKVSENGLRQIVAPIAHEGAKSVASIIIPNGRKNCLVAAFENIVRLLCENPDEDVPFLEFHQTFRSTIPIEVVTSLIDDVPFIFILNAGLTPEQPIIDIWRYNENSNKFNRQQVIYVTSPNSIATISYRGNSYLAIASGHVQNARHAGLLDIRKYDGSTRKFNTVQQISINAPFQVEFAELPSKELVLYVLTDNPTQPLVVYEYLGISGFKEKITASTIPKAMGIMSFTSSRINEHFILAQNEKEIRVIQAIFKGNKK